MKIAIVQFYTSECEYAKYSEPINRAYAEKHGYDYFVEKDEKLIEELLQKRSFTWYKPLLLKNYLDLHPDTDWILYLDMDAVFYDFSTRIEEFLDEEADLIAAKDIGHHSVMNAGVLLFRNSEWTRDFLDTWWNLGSTLLGSQTRDLVIPEEQLEVPGFFERGLWHDQTCLTYLYEKEEECRKRIKVIPSTRLNSQYANEDAFVFHAFAYGNVEHRTLDTAFRKHFYDTSLLPSINLVVYHIYCVNNYLELAKKQVGRLVSSGLYNWCDRLEITCIDVEGKFSGIDELFKDLPKVNLNKFINNSYEYEGIKKVWEYSQTHSGKVFYFHTKGVSNVYKNFSTGEISERKKKGVNWWREMMEYFLIDNYQDCVQKLDDVDQCGVTINGNWWWGNFWWSNLGWVAVKGAPAQRDRWYYEGWLNDHKTPKAHEFFHYEFSPYYSDLPHGLYRKGKEYGEGPKIELISAFYGALDEQQDEGRKYTERIGADVLDKLQANLDWNQGKRLCIRVDNDIAGDPYFGIRKSLEVYFLFKGEKHCLVVDEGHNLIFPPRY